MPSIPIKTADELARQRRAGALLASVFDMLDKHIQPGITTMEINNLAEAFIVNQLHSRPASKGQYDYPFVLNTSVNEVVCHGMPKETEHLKSGAIVNVDITLEKDGLIADSSKMYLIGDVSPLARRLVKKTYEAMWKGIKVVRPGATLGDIGHAIQSHVESNGYSVVREYCGHGVGQEMHEEPQVLHYGKPGEGAVLREGMVFTIEPMVNQGDSRTKIKKDGWTVVTRDKKLSAQWEHTVAVTADGVEVLTLREDEIIPS
ncbi:type I methionyl aminopeptidase [Raoultella planticola]|uniref:Methionine aminopeptidase n=1 Tax=Raoultella planticola TaxID=575 RepID=A0ABU5LY33_RAOPL|nr:type I methionyl aminopeptidase [Raoultella planticola]MDW4553778.1 type I methionyl aminopeptidase [Raoultella planticola]MDZ7444304.1 type I methionyl aminopeptidase [Raoultella planticola]MDZ7464867.1 type I methionyl aminopeptidase [Raoultella planticola]MDZ7506103.1 type I methionyl aminopeptidase [Raoultella planticola]MEA5393772.1 type I methionyl aminopeptidase [Raoultella planticola]